MYTYFGGVFGRLLKARGYNQSTFAAECRRRGLRVGKPGRQRDVGQRSVSDWMRGKVACPREVPGYTDIVLDLTEEEWVELALAFAYGQTFMKEDVEDLPEFRRLYRTKLVRESEGRARER
ncbi:MAG: hypothetical protein ACR2JR_00285 [Rubrobacteraceae bacterium]